MPWFTKINPLTPRHWIRWTLTALTTRRFNMKTKLFLKVLGCLVLACLTQGVYAQTDELGLQQTLRLAEEASPDLKAAVNREKEAMESSTIAESGFFPTLDLAAMDSAYPGSASGADGLG